MVAFVEIHAGGRGVAETLLREGIAELERLGELATGERPL